MNDEVTEMILDRLENIEKKQDLQFEKYDKVKDKTLIMGTKVNILWGFTGLIGIGVIGDVVLRIFK